MALRRGLIVALLALPAPAGARNWGERLLAEAARRHPGVGAMRIDATDRDGRPIIVEMGSAGGSPAAAPLADAMGRRIGTLSIAGSSRQAARIAADVSRHLYRADDLAAPDPFVPGAIDYPRAQALIDRTLAATPGLVTLAMHVAPPGAANAIIASSFGRIGKAADADDAEVIATGAIRRETTDEGRRLAVELPLLDRGGRVVGALSTSFRVSGDRADVALARSLALRDRLARRIGSLDELVRR